MLAKNQMAEAWTLLEIASAAEATITKIHDKSSPIDCEIAEGEFARWFLVRTFPGDDARALRWLARRRFGAFRPMQQRRLRNKGGQLVQGWEPAFPGWIFVLCWDIDKMRNRIKSTPGVMGLLCDPATNKPVPIEEGFIDRLRALSWVYDERAPRAGNYAVRASRHERRIKSQSEKTDKRTRIKLKRLKNALKAQGKWQPSTWETANELAPQQRIALLQRALNAPSLVACAR